MKTPITDKLSLGLHEEENVSYLFAYITMSRLARKLELDRAALIEALECVAKDFESFRQIAFTNGVVGTWGVGSLRKSEAALSTARANFPNED